VDVPFNASSHSSLGVEVELAIVDVETGGLASSASSILADLSSQRDGADHPFIKAELYECTLEVITGVCDTVAEARADIGRSIAELRGLLEPRRLDVISAGLHPFSSWQEQKRSTGERYDVLVDRIQWPAKRLITHGIHYHVGVRSAEKSIAITNASTTYLPMLLALSASSPYWHGTDTGLASTRTKVFESMPTTGLPPRLADWSEFEGFMASLIRAGSIASIREVWWDVRPHPNFGTIEFRMCDAMPTLTEICALAAFAQSIVERFDQLLDRGYRLPIGNDWILRENKWRAARYGLAAELVVDPSGRTRPIANLIEETIDELMPIARRLDCSTELADVLTILETGSSASRQRRVLDEAGSMTDIVTSLRAELRTDTPGAQAP
jgi:carboxylate-amine ligase